MDRRMEREDEFLSLMGEADAQDRPTGQQGLTRPASADDVAEQPKAR
jgi:hypothetical protein